MADNNTNFAQVMNGVTPVKTEVASTSTETQSGANAFAAALRNSSGQEFSGGYTRNDKAGFDSPRNQAEVLREQEKAKKLEAHKAALVAAEQQQLIWDRQEQETLQEIQSIQNHFSTTASKKKVPQVMTKVVAQARTHTDITRTIGGGAGIKLYWLNMANRLIALQKRDAGKSASWATAIGTKKKKQGAKGANFGKNLNGANKHETATIIHSVNNENASRYGE